MCVKFFRKSVGIKRNASGNKAQEEMIFKLRDEYVEIVPQEEDKINYSSRIIRLERGPQLCKQMIFEKKDEHSNTLLRNKTRRSDSPKIQQKPWLP